MARFTDAELERMKAEVSLVRLVEPTLLGPLCLMLRKRQELTVCWLN